MNLIEEVADFVFVKEHVSDELAEWRMGICAGTSETPKCGNFQKRLKRCADCGCWLEAKTKSKTNRNPKRPQGETTHCPLGKWNDKETANIYSSIVGLDLLK